MDGIAVSVLIAGDDPAAKEIVARWPGTWGSIPLTSGSSRPHAISNGW